MEKTDCRSFTARWRDFASETTLHGVHSASRPGAAWSRRIIWLCVLTSMCAIYVTLAAMSVASFYRYMDTCTILFDTHSISDFAYRVVSHAMVARFITNVLHLHVLESFSCNALTLFPTFYMRDLQRLHAGTIRSPVSSMFMKRV